MNIIQVVAAVIRNEQNRILITKRPANSHLGGLWEFPGGKIDADETPKQALRRELKEELDILTVVRRLLWQETFQYPGKTIHIRFFECQLKDSTQKVSALQVADFKWVRPEDLSKFDFPPADAAFIEFLRSEQKTPHLNP